MARQKKSGSLSTSSRRNPFRKHHQYVVFKKNEDFTGRIGRSTWNGLYDRGCIEAADLQATDLENPIHPIFRREAFTNISDGEYDRLQPEVTLASRFITEKAYMGFWTHICTGEAVDDDRPGKKFKGKWRIQAIEDAMTEYSDDNDEDALVQTRQALEDMADALTFFILDEEWCEVEPLRAAESFFDSTHKDCRRNEDLTDNDCGLGQCIRCDNNNQAHCYICGMKYYSSKTVPQLKDILRSRDTDHTYGSLRKKAELIAALKELDNEEEEDDPAPVYRTTDGQLSELQVGLHWDVVKHIRRTLEDEVWTESEEVRFQMAVAATLCHELAHIFWWWTQRRCYNCEEFEPWWSRTEQNFHEEPELGVSWEYWVFGSRVPGAGKLQQYADQALPNIFQRLQWNWVDSTEKGGQGRHDALIHDFIFPVAHINSWFQESTWEAIAEQGRKEGRPSHNDMVIMREYPTNMIREDSFGNRECTIEEYSHAELVAHGGFNGGNYNFLYGATGLRSKRATKAYVERLRRDLREKLEKEQRSKKSKAKKSPSTRSKTSSDVPKMKTGIEGPRTGRVTKRRTPPKKLVKG
ncbi:Nn.00g054030.m01.CDS01 [Neocucurbitaria sp. VM-36]